MRTSSILPWKPAASNGVLPIRAFHEFSKLPRVLFVRISASSFESMYKAVFPNLSNDNTTCRQFPSLTERALVRSVLQFDVGENSLSSLEVYIPISKPGRHSSDPSDKITMLSDLVWIHAEIEKLSYLDGKEGFSWISK